MPIRSFGRGTPKATLAGGFGSFDAADIQSLERGHALCRVERADHWIVDLEKTLKCCCMNFGKCCDIKVRPQTRLDQNLKAEFKPEIKPIPDGGYTDEKDFINKVGKVGEDGVIDIIQTSSMKNGEIVGGIVGGHPGIAAENSNIVLDVQPGSGTRNVLAHELGHVAGFTGGSLDDPDHSPEPPAGTSYEKTSVMAPHGGGDPTKTWCSKVDSLAKP